MKPSFVSHTDYQQFVFDRLRQHYSNGAAVLVRNDWPVIWKCYISDLSHTTSFLCEGYSAKGPAPRDPASMLRSYLLFLLVRPEIGLTKWVDELYRVPLYAILSGFEPGDIPGVGTFYDFLSRFWAAEKSHLKPKVKPRRRKPKRGKKGEKAPTTSTGKVKRLVERILRNGMPKQHQPFDRLLAFFQSQIIAVSEKYGLLGNATALTIAGDGTPVVTSAYPRSKAVCDCHARGIAKCHHPRLYSQPDCDSGWDSARERYFNGYHLYMLTAANSPHDLPLYPKLQPASRHDALSFVVSTVEFSQRFTLGMVDKMLLDAAHDAGAIYDLLAHQNIQPFIDLNVRATKNLETHSDIRISPKGIPICLAGLEMKRNGFEPPRKRFKWICPLMTTRTKCACTTPCSSAKYGRSFHTACKDNPRLFPETPRDSEAWKIIYKRRTTVERSNKREKMDYKLESGRHRSTKMWYIRLYGIMICQHVDAWFAHRKADLEPLQTQWLQSAS
ncbi:transposase [Paenibacillus durus]|uniref:Transposase n=1 Tax=Paenibacillus durus TaxID=44251 RepID=A0A089HUF0_PAEDU|nr:transposase [Paenibacillus durus]AIQ14365.1 transposase [Paenibacillus durus]